jgi:hypothetical protein
VGDTPPIELKNKEKCIFNFVTTCCEFCVMSVGVSVGDFCHFFNLRLPFIGYPFFVDLPTTQSTKMSHKNVERNVKTFFFKG